MWFLRQSAENTWSSRVVAILPSHNDAVHWSQLQRGGLGEATALDPRTHGNLCPPTHCFPLPPRACKCKKQLIWLLSSRRAKGQ